MMKKLAPTLLLIPVLMASCSSPKFKVNSFDALTNFEKTNDTLVLEMDLSAGPFVGVTLPSQNGTDRSKTFHFSFEVENVSSDPAELFYKIYYQNESYKYAEISSGNLPNSYNKKAAENFYGSWVSDSLIGFKKSTVIPAGSSTSILDSLQIAGNPLNEQKYFSGNSTNPNIAEEVVKSKMAEIKTISEWYNAIVEKAAKRNKSAETQLREDAVWTLQNEETVGNINQRWQRNPRVGSYKFMLVAGSKEDIAKLPLSIQDFSRIDDDENVRINPFYYFKYGLTGKNKDNIQIAEAAQVLKTYAVLRPEEGMFYDGSAFINTSQKSDSMCNKSDEAFRTAHFKQFVNEEVLDSSLHNIDIKTDVGGRGYRRAEFEENKETASRNIPSYVKKPTAPCENAWYDPSANALVVQNPGNTDRPYKKENAGVEGRIGFAYGKFRARIKFPETLSDENVWNGITCAYWLKFQSLDDWNTRDVCEEDGYLVHGGSPDSRSRKAIDSYSEIDIEIIKTSRNWPKTSYGYDTPPPNYDAGADNNLIVSCTNWDLACPDPENFGIGVQPFTHNEKTYNPHRWDKYYRALTLKTERPVTETVGNIFFYEIDWSPEEITWRIGRTVEEMEEVGYMDKTITKIPNNQMVPVMSQEFHYGHWWPTTPFPQGDIPYPDNPITGYLYEIVIE